MPPCNPALNADVLRIEKTSPNMHRFQFGAHEATPDLTNLLS